MKIKMPKLVLSRSHSASSKKHGKLQSGQSLTEMAISMSVLVLLFSGIVDLGRAYFATVMLNNIASEGSHWASTYPGCIATASNSNAGPLQCRGTNSIVQRVIGEDMTLDRNRFSKVCATTLNSLGVSGLYTNTDGNTVTVKVVYRMVFITPVITAMFGSGADLTGVSQEVVRGKGVPDINGTTIANQGGVSTTCS